MEQAICFQPILRYALAVVEHVAKGVLGLRKALIGSLEIPASRCGTILLKALAVIVRGSKCAFSPRITLLRSLAIQLDSQCPIFRHTLPVPIQIAERVLRL